MREHLVREVAAFYLLSLGRHNIQFVHLRFQSFVLDTQILFSARVSHLHQALLNLWVKYDKPLKKNGYGH